MTIVSFCYKSAKLIVCADLIANFTVYFYVYCLYTWFVGNKASEIGRQYCLTRILILFLDNKPRPHQSC